VLVVSNLNEEIALYSNEEQQILASYFNYSRRSLPVYDIYESYFELDMWDFQEHTTESYPLFTKEKYCEEINHPWLAEIIMQ
jgi:hypothetical protein